MSCGPRFFGSEPFLDLSIFISMFKNVPLLAWLLLGGGWRWCCLLGRLGGVCFVGLALPWFAWGGRFACCLLLLMLACWWFVGWGCLLACSWALGPSRPGFPFSFGFAASSGPPSPPPLGPWAPLRPPWSPSLF